MSERPRVLLHYQSALIESLRTRRMAGAMLDVFECEPLAADSPWCRPQPWPV